MEVIAHLYNDSLAQHDGRLEAVMCIKRTSGGHGVYADGVATLDMERHRADDILPDPWQTDTSIGPWGYRAGATYRPVGELVHELVDIVSKNGNVLLNVPPKADGTLDDETVARLEGIGDWLAVNGEAIYGTRPWLRHAEGDLRFTRKAGTLYVTALAWPAAGGTLNVRCLARDEGIGPIAQVALLGGDGSLRWGQDQDMLRIVVPEVLPCGHALSFRVEFAGGAP
jgi:alpha-L-fucosidase